ncbi:transposase [Streptomyces anulatus]|uniref:transposase n=1 Tax=Streptomyces anulatus TaxID=1892 RepID=UPI003F4A8322
MGSRGDLTDAHGERLEPLLPVSNRRCGRWRDHRQVINGVLYRIRTGVQMAGSAGPVRAVEDSPREASSPVGERHLGTAIAADPSRGGRGR